LSKVLESCSAAEGVPETADAVVINKVIDYLVALVPHRGIIADARDAAIAAIVTNAKRADVAKRIVDRGGVRALLITASCARTPLQTAERDDGVSTSKETRMQVSVAMAELHRATGKKVGKKLEAYERLKVDCLGALAWTQDPISNVPVVYTLVAIIQGVIDLANDILDSDGVMDAIIKMAKSELPEAMCAAAEALSHAATDKKRSKALVSSGFATLKRLYNKDLPDVIRVRALCGLCKMGSQGGGAVNQRTLADGAVVNLAKKLKPYLVDPKYDTDIKKWASEGLAYLTLDADVKELVVGDRRILKTVASLCTDADPSVQFGLANLLVNVTNSFDKREKTEEHEAMEKLGKFAGEVIPEPHPLDADEHIEKRVDILVDANIVTAMVHLAKSDSERVREQVSRVFLAMAGPQRHRGKIVAQGGAKALVPLVSTNSEKGIKFAAHALAKIAITQETRLAFPGQRAAELVRPLIQLTRSQKPLEQFEACMALTNLAVDGDSLRAKILAEKGIPRLEDLMYDEDWLIRRAATECLCNLMMYEKVWDMFATSEGACWPRIKLWILLSGCAAEDLPCALAAGGGLATLSSSPEVCKRITEETQGMLILKENAASGQAELQFRALYIMNNMAKHSKELAEAVCAEKGLEMLSALHLTLSDDKLKQYVTDTLESIVQHGLLASIDEAHARAAAFASSPEFLQGFQRPVEEESEEDDEEDEENEIPVSGDGDAPEQSFAWPHESDTPKFEEITEEELREEGIVLDGDDVDGEYVEVEAPVSEGEDS